jgi:hypothetical protein
MGVLIAKRSMHRRAIRPTDKGAEHGYHRDIPGTPVAPRLEPEERVMIRIRKTKCPPILAIYLAVVIAFGALISTRVHAPAIEAVQARLTEATQTASL